MDRTCRRCDSRFSSKKGAQFYCDSCRVKCAVDGCDLPAHTRGYCGTHWTRVRNHGDAGGVERLRQWQFGPCSVEGCGRKAEKLGFCELHYMRQRKGALGPATVMVKPRGVPCEVEGCTRLADAAGLCNMHYTRRLLHGDVGEAGARIAAQGEGHINISGYRKITVDGRNILEHRYVMEKVLGRRMHRNETVHHIDGDKLNNSLDNLELWVSHQPSGQRVRDKVRAAIKLLREHPDLLADEDLRLVTLESQESTDILKTEGFGRYSDSILSVGLLGN